ncbi:MAG: hypothetical protein ACFFD8_05275 [Candidatus Thorarchaeota archaeon]
MTKTNHLKPQYQKERIRQPRYARSNRPTKHKPTSEERLENIRTKYRPVTLRTGRWA